MNLSNGKFKVIKLEKEGYVKDAIQLSPNLLATVSTEKFITIYDTSRNINISEIKKT